MKTGHVYILQCNDGSFYTGVTNHVIKRVCEHNAGTHKGYTKSRRPVKLMWDSGELPIIEAIALEKQIKGWRREKKLALIQGRFRDLESLAKAYTNKNDHPSTSSG